MKNTIKNIIMTVAIILCFALAGGWIAQTVIGKQTQDKPAESGENEIIVTLPEATDSGIKLTKAMLTSADYEDYGISPRAVSAVSIYVDNPSEFVTYNWAMEWKTAKSEAVTSSVQLSASTGTSVSVSALKAFDTQVILTCSAYLGGSSKVSSSAICTIDYAQKLDSISLNGNRIENGQTIELSSLVGADWDIVDALNGSEFTLTGNLGIGSLTGTAIPTVNGNVTVKSVMGMNYNNLSGTLPYTLPLAGFIYEQMYLSPEYYLEGMLEGNNEAIAILFECVAGYDKDIEFTVNYSCGSDSGTVTFYVNISDSLFANYSARNVALNRTSVVL